MPKRLFLDVDDESQPANTAELITDLLRSLKLDEIVETVTSFRKAETKRSDLMHQQLRCYTVESKVYFFILLSFLVRA